MPGDNFVVNYDINVVSQQAVTSIDRFVAATKKLQQAKNQFSQLNNQINSVNNRFATWSKKAPVIQINTSQAEKKIDRLLGKLTQLETKMRSAGLVQGGVVGGGSARGGSGTAIVPGATGKAGAAQPRGTQRAQKATNAGTRAVLTRGPRTGRGNVRYQALGQTLIDTGGVGVLDFVKGMGIAYGIAGIGTLVSNVVKDAADYNNLMQTAKNILGSHDKNKLTFENRFKEMERIIRNVGVETKFTAPEVADASKFLAMAGFDVEAINKSIRPIADIALVGDNDLGETADVVTNIMTGFGIAPSQVRRAADIMTMTFTKSNTTLMEIAESYKYAGSLLSRNGTSFEEATAAIGILGDAGIKGSQAGTTLRTMALNIAKPTKAQAEMWEQLGISRTDKNGNIRPLIELFQELNERNLTLGQFGQLFHKTAASGASALAAHVDKWNEIIEANFMSEGMSSRLADSKKNTIQGLWYQMTSSFTEAGMQAFEDLEGPIKDMLNKAIGWLKSQETIDMIKRFSLTIADMGKTLLKVTKVIFELYKRFEPLVNGWLKLQLVLSMVLIPLRAVSAMLNFGRFVANGAVQIGNLALRFNRLGQSMWGVVRANNALNASAGVGGSGFAFGGARRHSFGVWARYARIKGAPILSGFGTMLGAAGGAMLGSQIGEEGSTASMLGSIAGSIGGVALGAKLPAIFSALGAAGTGVLGVLAAVGVGLYKIAEAEWDATKAAREWSSSFRTLGLEKLNLNSVDGVLIGNMRIVNSTLHTQNEKLQMSIDLYRKYWKAKNGEGIIENQDVSQAFVDTQAGSVFKNWIDQGRGTALMRGIAKTLGEAGYGNYNETFRTVTRTDRAHGDTYNVRELATAAWEGIKLTGTRLSQEDAASILLARLAVDRENNPNAIGLENFLATNIIGVQNSALAKTYLQGARTNYIPIADQSLNNLEFSKLSEMSWNTIQTTPGYVRFWEPIANEIMQPWQALADAMEEFETNQTVNTSLLEQWIPSVAGPSAGMFLNGFGTKEWANRINDIYLNPTKYSFTDTTDALNVANGVLDALFAVYNSMNDKLKPMLVGYFADKAWQLTNFNGLNIPNMGVLNDKGQIEAFQNAFGGTTTSTKTTTPTTPTNNNGYQNQYRSQSATPKQIIVKIENLMNVESIDMSDPNVAATVNNLKAQMAQALIEVVADFDANAANLV